jgi:ABC-type transporter Mla subunit MlaD
MADTSGRGGVLVEFQPMSPEDMQRTMQFLLAHQAQFAADFERLSFKVDGLADKVDGLTDKVAGVTDAVARLTTVAGHTLATVGDLVGTVERLGGTAERLVDAQRRTDARLIEFAEQGKATDARLGALIDLFERHLREDHPPRPS